MTNVEPAPQSSVGRRIWKCILIGFGLGGLAMAGVTYNLVTLNSDAAALRNGLRTALPTRLHTRLQVSVGPVLLTAVRVSLLGIKSVPAEAHQALSSVSKASVGVYEFMERPGVKDRSEMFSAADRVMSKRGWTRTVAVNDRENLVLVYTPTETNPGSSERVCVAVCEENHLVIVAGTIRLEPLVDLMVQQHLVARR